MKEPHDQYGPEIQEALQGHTCDESGPATTRAEVAKLIDLEVNVLHFVA
jgi:hypothetical protein